MIKLNNVSLPVSHDEGAFVSVAAEVLKTQRANVEEVKILKKSIDARKKNDIRFIYSLAVKLKDERGINSAERYEAREFSIDALSVTPMDKNKTVAIIGAGPAGLFAALTLIKRGIKPIIFERGYEVERRDKEIEALNSLGILNECCNIQFGEGGAGTYSDGKLNTGTKSPYIETVLAEFVKFGAPYEITYLNKPHIGTDILKNVVVNIRKHIIAAGGKFYFGTKVDGFIIQNGTLCSVTYSGENCGQLDIDYCILACGHSARDTFATLYKSGVPMERKPFSIGVRIEHLQKDIDKAQYGVSGNKFLPAADYKLATHLKDGRGVYTFCMCPGGEVVCGSSEKGLMVTNGMSYHARNNVNANSALLVSVGPEDFGEGNELQGVEFQRKFERAAYDVSGGYKAAAQRLGDLTLGKKSTFVGSVKPSIKTGYTLCNLKSVLPRYIAEGIVTGAADFSKRLFGFNNPDAMLSGVETRSSSPVRILRDDNLMSAISGLYPCGEGAGYAGGITSAAVDGIKVALSLS